MEHTIKLEVTSTIDKTIYENSPWKNKKQCFQDLLLSHMDDDLGLFKRESKNLDKEQQEGYEILIKSLSKMKKSINKSIVYEVLNVDNNIETLKISFSFNYIPTPVMTPQKMVENFIFTTPIQEVKITGEIVKMMLEKPGRVPDKDKQKAEKSLELFDALEQFMEKAKSTLVVLDNDVELKNIFTAKKKKLKK